MMSRTAKIRTAALSLLLAAILVMGGCGGVVCKINGTNYEMNYSSSGVHSSFFTETWQYETGETVFSFDKQSTGIAILYGGRLWYALPTTENTVASMFTMTVISGGKLYSLNSQDNSSSLGGVSYVYNDNRIDITYQVWPDAIKEFCVTLTLSIAVTDGRLTVTTDTSQWETEGDAVVADFSLMPYFGAVTSVSSDVGFCLPDGSGVTVNPTSTSCPLQKTEYDVYTGTVLAPVYGVRVGTSAFANVTTKGDSALTVVCDATGTLKTVYNKYVLAEISRDGKCAVESYNGPVCAVYSFIGGNKLSFADISAAARSVFLEYGILTSSAEKKSHSQVLLRCTDDEGNVLTDTDDAQSLLGLLKGKGVENISLILEGILKEGRYGTTTSVNGDAGGRQGLSNLCTYATASGAKVYATCFLRTTTEKAGTLKDAANLRGSFATEAGVTSSRFFVKTGTVSDNADKLISASEKPFADGYYIADSAARFFSARNYAGQSAQSQSDSFSSAVSRLSDAAGVITSGGYFNSASGASILLGVPTSPALTPSDAATDEPFILAILHGCTEYSTVAVNSAEIPRLSMLKAIEYGASACVEWSCTYGQTDYYETLLADCADFMLETGKELGDLTNAVITDHYRVADGVFCTEYDGRTLVYVNYNNKSAVIGDITVPPYDFLRLN